MFCLYSNQKCNTMPLFGNKFSPKKTLSRKSTLSLNTETQLEELVQEGGLVKLQLGEHLFNFEKGDWIPVSGTNGNINKANQSLKHKIQEVEEENNLLKLKIEILLNMLTQTTAESHIQQREIDKLRKTEIKK